MSNNKILFYHAMKPARDVEEGLWACRNRGPGPLSLLLHVPNMQSVQSSGVRSMIFCCHRLPSTCGFGFDRQKGQKHKEYILTGCILAGKEGSGEESGDMENTHPIGNHVGPITNAVGARR